MELLTRKNNRQRTIVVPAPAVGDIALLNRDNSLATIDVIRDGEAYVVGLDVRELEDGRVIWSTWGDWVAVDDLQRASESQQVFFRWCSSQYDEQLAGWRAAKAAIRAHRKALAA